MELENLLGATVGHPSDGPDAVVPVVDVGAHAGALPPELTHDGQLARDLAEGAFEGDIDINGDGIDDTARYDVDGSIVIVTDTDGDGTADRITMVDPDGEFGSWDRVRTDWETTWNEVDRGRLG